MGWWVNLTVMLWPNLTLVGAASAQDHKSEKDFSKGCREEVRSYEAEISKDYRLNYRLASQCAADIRSLCPALCPAMDGSVCGGKVLRCLADKIDDIKAGGCRSEVFYYQKMEVENFQNDNLMAEAAA
jgi:golgi apparatus protein 1